jgi:uncharacterized protein (DUF4213/DUF364 family)
MVLEKTYELLKNRQNLRFEKLEITDVRIGLLLTAVRLSDGSCGVASTLSDYQMHCIKENRDFGDFTPSKIKGQKVVDLFETEKRSNVIDTLRIAVLNAISSRMITAGDYKIMNDTDPVDLIRLDQQKTVTIVGGFHSYIRKISKTDNKLNVLELDENLLAQEYKKFFVPADDFKKILPVSDIIIITGFTLVNNTIDGLLSSIPSKAQVIVTGPSSSIIPDVLFSYGVNMIGATQITHPDLLFTIVEEAGAGYHLFKYCARKICVLNE